MARSRSGLERITALALASGFLLTSSFGSVHDSHGAHHAAGAGHDAGSEAVAHTGGGATLFGGGSPPGPHSPDSAPEECPCLGGLCVLSVQGGPLERTAHVALDAMAPASAVVSADLTVRATGAAGYRQPPGRAPPAAV